MKRRVIFMQEESREVKVIEAFQTFRRVKVNNNLSPKSILHYDLMMDLLGKFYPNVDEIYCSSITRDTIDDFIEFLKERNPAIRATSINSYLKDIRTLFYFFMDRGYTKNFKINLLKEDVDVKEVYASEEIKALLEKPDIKKCRFTTYRDWVITCYLLGTGNRLGTVCNLKIKDVDFENNVIYLRKVKTRKSYHYPMSTMLEQVLQEYLEYRKGDDEDYLFCNKYGDRLTEGALIQAIARYNKKRGVEKTSVHLYRNTFAKSYLTNGGDVARLQKLLGHSTPIMSLRYARMYDSDLNYYFDERSPLDAHTQKTNNKDTIKMTKKRA